METPTPDASNDATFETLLDRIREAVSALESGKLSLEESIATYREGAELIEQSRKLIADAELRITELSDATAE